MIVSVKTVLILF